MGVFIALQLYPFGTKTLLISDMQVQYISYFSYYKSLFTTCNDLWYTFSKALGGDMLGFAAYYLFSPLNLLLLLFPDALLPVAVALMIAIKLSLCGLAFFYFLSAGHRPNVMALLFSTAYALIGYNITYLFNVMWLDGVILLPLVALGIHRIVEGKSARLYIGSLMAVVIINYYIGFMVCLFSVVYFAYRLLVTLHAPVALKSTLRIIGKYIAASLAAGGLSAVVWLPAVASLAGGKADFSFANPSFQHNFGITDLFTKLFVNTSNWAQCLSGLPNIFCGMLVVILVILYFLNPKIKLKPKLLATGLLALFFVSFDVYAINLIWHGFNAPVWYPYRYSFMVSFLLIQLAYESFTSLNEHMRPWRFALSGGLLIAATLLAFRKTFDFVISASIYFDVALALVFGLILYAWIAKPRARRMLLLLFALLQLTELSMNTYTTIARLQKGMMVSMTAYSDTLDRTEPVIRALQAEDSSVYRMEITRRWSHNDAMRYQYNGLSHFSSSEKTFVKDFLGRLGYRNNGNWANYGRGSTMAADSLLGVKYVIVNSDGFVKPYDERSTQDGLTVYQNPYALPLGFGVSQQVYTADVRTDNPFALQNNMFASMTEDEYDPIFTDASVTSITEENLTATQQNGVTHYQKIDADQDAYVRYQLTITSDQVLYAYLDAPDAQSATLMVNETTLGKYWNAYRPEIAALGQFTAGEQVTVTVTLGSDALDIGNVYFCYENSDVLQSDCDQLAAQGCDLTEISSSHLRGTFTAPEDGQTLLLSIPYEEAWHITVDGQPVQANQVFGALMAVQMPAGTHTVDLRYIPAGAYAGIAICTCTLVCLAAVWLVQKKRRVHDLSANQDKAE